MNKEEIIKGLKHEEFIVREAIYEHVCNLHLYDDKDINTAFIEFLKNDYTKINLAGLVFSKLNQSIVKCIIDLILKEKSRFIQERLCKILIGHYSLIKDLNYDFEKIFTDSSDLLLFKKIKHFCSKEPKELMQIYINNIENFYDKDEDTDTTKLMREAITIALIQTDEGQKKFFEYFELNGKDVLNSNEAFLDFTDIHMPCFVKPLCECTKEKYYAEILNIYMDDMDFLEYADKFNHYFSNICSEEFVNYYINTLKNMEKNEIEEYYYDIAQYLNSSLIDEFLYSELKTRKSHKIRGNILRILASKMDKNIIPYALDFIQKRNQKIDDLLELVLAPLLILDNRNDNISKLIIEESKSSTSVIDKFLSDDNSPLFTEIMNKLQKFSLEDKKHIKEYKKVRNLYDKISEDMSKYNASNKFDINNMFSKYNANNLTAGTTLLNATFDTSETLGSMALSNILMYKNDDNVPCITEEFIKNNMYKEKEKQDMLNSMLASEAGLFEVIRTERENGYVYLRNVLNNNKYCITDIGLSGNLNNDKWYMYTRIITYNGISFGTGLIIPFSKEDKFINDWIKENKEKAHNDLIELIELYNAYLEGDNKIEMKICEV